MIHDEPAPHDSAAPGRDESARTGPVRRGASTGLGWVAAVGSGGLTAGVLDIAAATAVYGVGLQRILQSVASGLLGRDAFAGGWGTAALGAGFQLLIATTAAASYVLASRRLAALVRRPLVYGPLFGIAVYFFMQHVVVPLSAARQGSFSWEGLAKGIAIHILFVGLPIALCARRFLPARDFD
jgi:hypothetical protein